jgi:hypothetical protein
MTERLAATRRSWHAVAELVLAGPQDRASHSIKLRVVPGGFATTKDPALRVERGFLVLGDDRLPLDGTTAAALGAATGAPAGAPADRYKDGSGVAPDEVLTIDDVAVAMLAGAFGLGDAALRAFQRRLRSERGEHSAPAATPVLWPEHFDVGITVDEVNYGVSPGDDFLGVPYAYVGPWQPRTGPFWNAPFGSARPVADFSTVDALVAYFREGASAP